MQKLRSILVGVDFSPGSAAALSQAVRLGAGSGGAVIRAVHVINTHVIVDLQRALSPMQRDIQASLEAEARRQWERFAADLPGKASIDFQVRVGNAASALLDEAAGVAADLIVIAMQSEAEDESGVGTVAGACVRRARTRVLLARPEQAGPFTRIVACVDFSDVSRHVVAEAASRARQDQAALTLLHVYEPPWRQLRYFALMPENTPAFQAGYRAHVLARLQEHFASLEQELAGLGHEFVLEEHHSAGRGIVEHAERTSADLLVLGTQAKPNLRELVLGGTAERILRQAPCSMLTVRGS